MIGGCGALPHAPAGEGRFRARRTENRACRREAPNLPRLRRTERPYGRQIKRCTRETKPPSLQTSKLPLAPAPPARPMDVPTSTQGRAVRARKAHVRPEGLREHGGLRTPRFGEGATTRHFTVPKRLERRLSAKRRAAGAVSGGAAERPMEPEAIRASPCVFAENFTEGHWDAPTGDAGDSGAPLRGDGETP